jgi:branched-chain amino acid transport system permease protein
VSEFLVFCVLGLPTGALIAGLATGVVLNFRGAGVVNLGLGGAATVGAYLFYGLRTGGYIFLPSIGSLPDRLSLGGPWATLPAVVVSVAIVAAFGALFDRFALARLRAAPALSRLIATLGLLMIAQSLVSGRFGTSGLAAPAVLTQKTFNLDGTPVPLNGLILGGATLLLMVALTLIYRFTRFGLRTRAASENEGGAALRGLSPTRLSTINTTAAFAVAALLGVLVAPISQLDPTVIANAIVPALGAALLARFTSFPIAVISGLLMGVIESLITWLQSFSWFPTSASLPLQGVSDVIFFIVIVIALVWRAKSLPERGTLLSVRLPKAPAPEKILRPTLVCATVGIIAMLVLPFAARQAMIFSAIALISCLSVVVLVGYTGQLSLVQIGLAGVAGFSTSRLATELGLGFPIGPVIAVAVTVAFGTVIALPALRVRGVNLAIVTIAAATALSSFGFSNPSWGASAQGSPVPNPNLLGLGVGPQAHWLPGYSALPSPVFGLLCLLIALALAMGVASLRRSHLGQTMLAIRSNERAAAAAGVNVARTKLIAFGIASFLVGIAGVLYAYNYGSVSADSYTLALALSFIAFVMTFGPGTVAGATAAAFGAVQGVVIYLVDLAVNLSTDFQLVLGGLALILTVVFHPDGVTVSQKTPPPPFRWIERGLHRILFGPVRTTPAATGLTSAEAAPAALAGSKSTNPRVLT